MKFSFVFITLLFLFSPQVFAEYATPQDFEKNQSPLKALVFLSEGCPCSRSHIEHLNALEKKFPQLKIYGVISEPPTDDEKKAKSDAYFQSPLFEFPVISDPSQGLVKKYGALKTPHLTLFEKKNDVYVKIYEGGVTNQKSFEKSTIKYLEENLTFLSKGQPCKYKNGQSLGCYIRRI